MMSKSLLRAARIASTSSSSSQCLSVAFSNINSFQQTAQRNFSTPITTNSWAGERLKEKGEAVVADPSIVVLTEESLAKPSDKVKKLSDDILALNMLEVNQLLKILTTRLGISDDEVNVHSFGKGGGGNNNKNNAAAAVEEVVAEAPKVKEAWDLKLTAFDAKDKIKIIKEVRTITGLGLKEAKELVEKAPCVLKKGLKEDEAKAFAKLLTDAGATSELL